MVLLPMMTIKEIEKAYMRFKVTTQQWQDLLDEDVLTSGTRSTGEVYRRVRVSEDPTVLERARILIAEWQAFYDMCKDNVKTTSLIPVSLYSPVPFIHIDTNRSTRISHRIATTVNSVSRDVVLDKYRLLIKRLKSAAVLKQVLADVMIEEEGFKNEPPDTLYRLRCTEFSEVVLSYIPGPTKIRKIVRVPAHGVLIVPTKDGTNIVVEKIKKPEMESIYRHITPLQCTPYGEYRLYRMSDIDAAEGVRCMRYYLLKQIEGRNKSFDVKAGKILADAPPSLRAAAVEKIKRARLGLDRLNMMDKALIEHLTKSGVNKRENRIKVLRSTYGKVIEEQFGVTFAQASLDAILRSPYYTKAMRLDDDEAACRE